MKINKKEFLNALKVIAPIVSKKARIQIFSNVAVVENADRTAVTLTTASIGRNCNLITATATVPTIHSDEDPISTTVPIHLLIKEIQTIENEIVNMVSIIKEHLTIRGDNFETQLLTLPLDDFPKIPTVHLLQEVIYQNDSVNTLKAIEYCAPAISNDETRPHINAMLLDTTGLFVATDGHRMHWSKTSPIASEQVLVPNDLIKPIQTALKSAFAIEIRRSDSEMFYTVGNVTFSHNRLDCEFPPYDQVIPKGHEKTAEISAKPFKAFCKNAKSKDRRGVKLDFVSEDSALYPNVLRATLENPSTGNTTSLIALASPYNCENLSICVNPGYLSDAILVNAEVVTLKMSGPIDPILIGNSEQGAVVMPMRI